MPSVNSVATYNQVKLAKLTGDISLEELVNKQLKVYASSLKQSVIVYSFYMLARMFELYPSQELV